MDQVFAEVEYARQDSAPDFGDAFETEFASQEFKPFQVALLFQEAEQIYLPFSAIQIDDSLLQP